MTGNLKKQGNDTDTMQPIGIEATAEPAPDYDPFHPANLRVSTDPAALGVRKVYTRVPVHKPNTQTWFRVHPDPAFTVVLNILTLKHGAGGLDKEHYLVTPRVAPLLIGEFRPMQIFYVIDRQGSISLWPIALPNPDGRSNSWAESALAAVSTAQECWTRLIPADGGYELLVTKDERVPEPNWPADLDLHALLKLAFKDKLIDDPDHEVIKLLQGRI
jgi:hypothetical protein